MKLGEILRVLGAETYIIKDYFYKQLESTSDQKAAILKIDEILLTMVVALVGIEEYWNGGSESAVDAAEVNREMASEALVKIEKILTGKR